MTTTLGPAANDTFVALRGKSRKVRAAYLEAAAFVNAGGFPERIVAEDIYRLSKNDTFVALMVKSREVRAAYLEAAALVSAGRLPERIGAEEMNRLSKIEDAINAAMIEIAHKARH